VGNLAGVAVEAEERLDALDLVQRLLAGSAQGHRIPAVKDNLESRGHCVPRKRDGLGCGAQGPGECVNAWLIKQNRFRGWLRAKPECDSRG
jgi:hypothetical protein